MKKSDIKTLEALSLSEKKEIVEALLDSMNERERKETLDLYVNDNEEDSVTAVDFLPNAKSLNNAQLAFYKKALDVIMSEIYAENHLRNEIHCGE